MASQSPEKMMAAVTESMRERTGRTLEEWVSLVAASGVDPLDQNAVRRWLKSEHGIPQNSRWAIADAAARAAGWERPETDEYINQQYSGAKAGLRSIFDRLRAAIEALGDDVTMEGRSTYTPFVRRRQFVAIAAATRSRVDVGLRYTKAPRSKLLTSATAPGQATHKLSLTAPEQVTEEVERLLRVAYDQNG
jgi:predicted transport protein